MYLENPNLSKAKLLGTMRWLSKVTDYKINIQNSAIFIDINKIERKYKHNIKK